jgi:hypothetical protein
MGDHTLTTYCTRLGLSSGKQRRRGCGYKRAFISPYAYSSVHATEFCCIEHKFQARILQVSSVDRRTDKSWHDQVSATLIWAGNNSHICYVIRVGSRIVRILDSFRAVVYRTSSVALFPRARRHLGRPSSGRNAGSRSVLSLLRSGMFRGARGGATWKYSTVFLDLADSSLPDAETWSLSARAPLHLPHSRTEAPASQIPCSFLRHPSQSARRPGRQTYAP